MEIVSIKDLTFSYPESGSHALDNISVEIKRGELVLLCGASGCGKSTLLRQLKPVIAPKGETSGSVLFNGKTIGELDERSQAECLGYVGQDPESMIVTDKVWHELAFSLESLGADSNLIRRRVAETAEFYGLTDSIMRSVSELSGGQKQLLALASAMTTRPELLILDEPTSQLDPIAARSLFDAVKRINRELGTTVIISEHRLEEVLPIADRVIFMKEGKLVSDSSPDSIDISSLDLSAKLSLPAPLKIWNAVNAKCKCPLKASEGRDMIAGLLGESRPVIPMRTETITDTSSVDIKNISFRYHKDSPDVLQSFSLKVRKGEFLGILGGNGSGKSTLLSLINGVKKPYNGKITVTGKALLMPQDPSLLFGCDTLNDDLTEITSDRELLAEVISLCRLEDLTLRHPSDLSGGEIQRAALAKLLLAEPDILLLDEPTKGTDALFKYELAGLIRSLCNHGITVIAVSHDIEFAASYCDRCAMLFSGELIGISSPQEFFGGNLFYTTSAARMSKDLISNAVTSDDVITALGCSPEKFEHNPPKKLFEHSVRTETVPEKKKRATPLRITARIISLLMFLFSGACCAEILPLFPKEYNIIPYFLLAFSVISASVAFSDGKTTRHTKHKPRRPTPASAALSVLTALLIPFTVYAGAKFFDTGKYLFVSLVVMLEAALAFIFLYEGRKPGTREIVTVSVLTAAAVAGRLAFFMLPQFKPVLAVVVISGAAFGTQAGFLVGSLSMLISNFMFGQGPWTPWQMFAMGLVGLISGIVFEKGLLPLRREIIAIYGFFSAIVIYGGIVNPSTLFIMHNDINRNSLAAVYTAGLPLDIIHGAASLGFLYALAPSILKKLERLKTKYGFFE